MYLSERSRRWFSVLFVFCCCPKDTADSLRDTQSKINLLKSLSGLCCDSFSIKTWGNVWSGYVSSQLSLAFSTVKFNAKGIRLSSVLFGVFLSWFPIFLTSSCRSLEVFRIPGSNFNTTSNLHPFCSACPFLLFPLVCDYSSHNFQRVRLRWAAHLLKVKIQAVR